MKKYTQRIFFILFMFLISFKGASAAIILQDNFDTCTTCASTTYTLPTSAGWSSWRGPEPAVTFDGVAHASGEITAVGRGGTGKSFKTWRHSGIWGNYQGVLDYSFKAPFDHIFMRYYLKMPVAFNCTDYSFKSWRFNYGGNNGPEIYLDFVDCRGDCRTNGKWSISDSSKNWMDVLNNAELRAIWDGNWHSIEWELGPIDKTLKLWIDGVQKYSNTTYVWSVPPDNYNFRLLQHFPVGNTYSHEGKWQNSWQAMEVDDFVISTSYIGPDGSTTPDITPPTISDPRPTAPLPYGTTSSTMQVTTHEPATCKYATSNVSYNSMPNTFATTNGITHTKILTGLTNGSSTTYYIRCSDSSNNANITSTAIAVSVSNNAPINGSCGSASGQSFASLSATSPNLCSAGTVASFSGSGPWTWGCNGINNGTSTSATACNASKTSTNNSSLFTENFDNNSFSARGWYDNYNHGLISTIGCQAGSCLEWSWTAGEAKPTNGGSMRKQFTPTDKLYLSFYTKFQNGWRGSGQTSHPHMMHVLSDLDSLKSIYSGLMANYLNAYIEFVSDTTSPYAIRPVLYLQDTLRTNTSMGAVPNNLTAATENRSVNYCNGYKAGQDQGQIQGCQSYDGYSVTGWKNEGFSLTSNVWHKVEVYFQMNTISNNVGQADGIMKEWIDGQEVISHSNIIYRTAQDATKKWDQFVLAPYMGGGSPITQKMWIDELTVANSLPGSSLDTTPPAIPTGLGVQ